MPGRIVAEPASAIRSPFVWACLALAVFFPVLTAAGLGGSEEKSLRTAYALPPGRVQATAFLALAVARRWIGESRGWFALSFFLVTQLIFIALAVREGFVLFVMMPAVGLLALPVGIIAAGRSWGTQVLLAASMAVIAARCSQP